MNDFEILEEGDNHAIVELDDQKYLVEDKGYDPETNEYLFEVINDEVVSTVENIEDPTYPTPDRASISASEIGAVSSYGEAVEAVLDQALTEKVEDPIKALDQYGEV